VPAGLNMMATIITMRAPGDDLVAPADLRVVGVRHRDPDGARGADADRNAGDGGARPHDRHHVLRRRRGRSSYLSRTSSVLRAPEVYILALPGSDHPRADTVFTRKPLWGYKLAVSGMLGVTLMSFFVWQHHCSSAASTPICARSTCSPPRSSRCHGLHLPVRDGHAVEGTHDLHGADAVLLRGCSTSYRRALRVMLSTSDDVGLHGSFFVMAHFHYTIMGG